MKLPNTIKLVEVGPRDGFQLETQIIPTELKLEIINNLVDAGVQEIQVTSFVNPKMVPQMADADHLIRLLPQRKEVLYTGLVLNTRGLKRAWKAGLKCVEISISASDTHSRKNTGMSHIQAVKQAQEMIYLAHENNMQAVASIQCSFGCVYEGEIALSRILNTAHIFIQSGISRLSLADTTGMGNPVLIKQTLKALMPKSENTALGLHLHDTRGLGLVNLMAGLECGITHFDTSLGGMGGCPFVRGAAGNIASEDTIYLMESMKIKTGIDRLKIAQCSKKIESFLGKTLPGKLYKIAG